MFLDTVQPPEPTAYHRFHDVLLRFISLSLLLLSALAWLRMVGALEFGGNPDGWRFDLMPAHWKVASIVTAVVGPVAAVGLWLLSSWGVTLWLALAFFQIAIFSVLADRFELRPALVAFHAICLIVYIGVWLRIAVWERKHRLG